MEDTPLVSLCMMVKNGMPYLPEALESVRFQTYKNIEFVVQDSCSTDGTTEYLLQFQKSVKFPVRIVTEADSGIADGINRSWKRAKGTIFVLIEADNMMQAHHVEYGVKFFKKNPEVGILCTSQNMIGADGRYLNSWTASPYDLLGQMCAESVVPSGSAFMNKRVLGDKIYYNTDRQLGHCPDYEFWLRAGTWGHDIIVVKDITYNTRISDQSGSCNYDRYEEFCLNKLHGLNLFLDSVGCLDLKNPGFSKLIQSISDKAKAGIYIWAASHVLTSKKYRKLAWHLYLKAKSYAPNYFRVQSFPQEYDRIKA